jgi:hypothetical protein
MASEKIQKNVIVETKTITTDSAGVAKIFDTKKNVLMISPSSGSTDFSCGYGFTYNGATYGKFFLFSSAGVASNVTDTFDISYLP